MSDDAVRCYGNAQPNDTHLLADVPAIDEGVISYITNPKLARLLNDVSKAPNPVRHFLEHCVEEMDPNDIFAAWDLAGFLLEHRDESFCVL